jgi:hypothetical protein
MRNITDCRLDLCGSEQGLVVRSVECSNETLVSIFIKLGISLPAIISFIRSILLHVVS